MAGVAGERVTDLTLSLFEKQPGFRADLLLFLRLAGTHVQSLFWTCFPAEGNPRKKMLALAKTLGDQTRALTDPKIRLANTTDPLNAGFRKLLEAFDEPLKKAFIERLRIEHGIFLRFDEFQDVVNRLREKRHWLEHYDDRIKQGTRCPVRDEDVFKILPVFLLPELCSLLHGRMSYWGGRGDAKVHPQEATAAIHRVREIFETGKTERRQSLKAVSEDERRRRVLEKTKRKYLASGNQPWERAYRALCTDPTDYRAHTFRLHYTFIGPQNLRALFACLGSPLRLDQGTLVYEGPTTRRLNFRQDVEPFYRLAVTINLALHRYLEEVPKNKTGKDKDKIQDELLRDVRNEIAHNGLFWRVKRKDGDGTFVPFRDLLARLLATLPKKHDAACLCDQLESLLRKQNYPTLTTPALTPGDPPKTERIRRWTAERRAAVRAGLEDGTVIRHDRTQVRSVVAGWMRDLQAAGQAKGLQHAGKNAI